jgi:hypothetical protein
MDPLDLEILLDVRCRYLRFLSYEVLAVLIEALSYNEI